MEIDVTDSDRVEMVFSEVRKELGSINILLCFAGVSSSANSIEVSIEHFRKTMDINTTGSFLCAQIAAR